MVDFSISAVKERLFNSTKHEKVVARSSNPFASTSFKGNVLTADVFETKSKPSMGTKLKSSALVGSIANLGTRLHNGIDSVISFGNKVKDSVVGGWNKLNEIEISIANPITSIRENWMNMMDARTVNMYCTQPVSNLEDMFKGELGFVAQA